MSGPPALSVVVATTGRQTWRRTVDSLRNSAAAGQAATEILLVWQAPDHPPVSAELRVLDVIPVSLSYARNCGLAESQGDFVAFVDDDEVVEEGYVRGVLRAFATSPHPEAIFGAVLPLDGNGVPYCMTEGEQREIFRGRRAPWRVGTGGNMAFRRSALVRAAGFDVHMGVASPGRSGEDTEIILRFLRSGSTVVFDPDVVVRHPKKTEAEALASRQPYGFGTGRLARRNRDVKVAAQYSSSLALAFLAAQRTGSARRRLETWKTLQGFAVGVLAPGRWMSPVRILDRMPQETGRLLPAELAPLPVRFAGQPHFRFRAGGRVLHVHDHPDPALLQAYELRERLRGQGLAGVPRLHGARMDRNALWVVEDFVAGRPPRLGTAEQWLPSVSRWALQLSCHHGSPIGESPMWPKQRERVLGHIAPGLRKTVARALDDVAACPSTAVHGSLHRRNVLLTGEGFRVGGWEHAQSGGLPGQDLLLLHASARSGQPDARLLAAVVLDPGHPLGVDLQAAGLPGEVRMAGVLAASALWAAREAAAAAALGSRTGSSSFTFGPLLERLARTLA